MREILKLIHEHASHHPSVTNRLQGSPPILPSRSRRSFSCSCSTARPSPHRHSACWASRFVERSLPTLRQSAVDDRRCHCFASLRYLEQQLEPAVERRAPPRMVFPPTARAILNQGPSAKLLALLETPLRQARQLLLLSVLGAEWLPAAAVSLRQRAWSRVGCVRATSAVPGRPDDIRESRSSRAPCAQNIVRRGRIPPCRVVARPSACAGTALDPHPATAAAAVAPSGRRHLGCAGARGLLPPCGDCAGAVSFPSPNRSSFPLFLGTLGSRSNPLSGSLRRG